MEGAPFGRYRLVKLLGRGGMGEVWRAYDTETDRVVALKVLLPHLTQDHGFEQRFRREALTAASINEPHVVPIHGFGEIDGRLYVDMRLIEGNDLQSLLSRGRLHPARAVALVEQVASALQAAHRSGLVHRDIKPSNILVTDEDFAYLIDFGIARAADQTGLTTTGSVMGTWAYMAPERFGTGADSRADVYALACVLHECLTGSRPFPGNSLEQQFAAHFTNPPPRPSAVVPGLSTAMDDVIATGMAKNPDQRYQTAVDLARAARLALTAPVEPAYPVVPQPLPNWSAPTPPRRKVGRGRAAAVLALPIAILVAALVFTGLMGRLYLGDRADADARRVITQTATEAISTLWSYTPDNIDGLSDRAGRYLSGDFQAQYRKFVDGIVAPNKEARVTNTTEVVGAGVESLNGNDASAIVYANTTSTSPQTQNKPTLKYLSYRLTMTKHDSRWLITRMSTITSKELEPAP